MIYLSAQPDSFYFLWQLKLQLFNFSQLGIGQENIHVLIAYDPKRGLNLEFSDFISENKQATFFIYPDLRKSKTYLSSIRPYLICRHFLTYQNLENEIIFYHDADILFRVLPDFDKLSRDKVWYASNTSWYLNKQYIVGTAGERTFNQMCKIVGIDPSVVEANNGNAGGAQYLIKYCKTDFWKKIERDCEKLYQLLEKHNAKQDFCERQRKVQIQSWYADMWVLWWNAILSGYLFKVHSELDFCWAENPIERWNATKILHYTGNISKDNPTLFRKSNYVQYPPFYDNLNEINKKTCSYPLKKMIRSYNAHQLKDRIYLGDASFLILARIDSTDRLDNIKTIIQYLCSWFKTNILILEAAETSQLEQCLFPPEVQYSFIKDDNSQLNRAKYNNQLINMAKTPYIAIYDTDVVFPLQQLLQAVEALRQGSHAIVSPYDGSFANVDPLLKAIFMKSPDPELFETNVNKVNVGMKRSYGGAILLNREIYVHAGMENENIFAWGPDDVERVKRMEILGYPTKRIPGNLYHLTHERGINSGYCSIEERCTMMEEYLKISSMRKTEMRTYIKTWKTYA